VHIEGADARNHIARDFAEADQPDRLARAADAHQGQRLLLLEVPGTRITVGLAS
jgi:hypothetical protein